MVNQILDRPIQLADQFTKALDRAALGSQNKCFIPELKSKTEKLVGLLRQLSTSSSFSVLVTYYDRPVRLIMNDLERILEESLFFLLKHYCAKCIIIKIIKTIKRFRTYYPTMLYFRKMLVKLDNSIGDVSWLIRFCSDEKDVNIVLLQVEPNNRISFSMWDKHSQHCALWKIAILRVPPPIVSCTPIISTLWKVIAILHDPAKSIQDRSYAAVALSLLARDDQRYMKFIIQEGGVEPLLKWIEEGPMEDQEDAVRSIGHMRCSWESLKHLHADVCKVFAKILIEGSLKVQVAVAWAVSKLADDHQKCQDLFVQHNVVRLLVDHLAFETVQLHSNNVRSKTNSNANANEDPATKDKMKAMVARALWKLAKGNSVICRSLQESTTLYSFAVLLEKGSEDAQLFSACALMEITEVVEQDAELRIFAFSPSPARKCVVDQLLLKIMEKTETEHFLVVCIRAIGNLTWTFEERETRMIGPLVRFLDVGESGVKTGAPAEACIALTKFACTDNYFHLEHSKVIITAGGAKHLIQILYHGECIVQLSALALVYYIALHVPESEELARAEVLAALSWASKQSFMTKYEELDRLMSNVPLHVPEREKLARSGVLTTMFAWESQQSYMTKDETLLTLLQEAKTRLNLHQSSL